MAADWSLAAVIIAIIALAFTPAPQKLVERLATFLHGRIWPASRLCETLEWRDIQDERALHMCNTRPSSCAHHQSPTFATFFTAKNASRSAKKPAKLDLNTTYLRTDTMVLKAFMVLMDQNDVLIRFEPRDNVLTASINVESRKSFPGYATDVVQVTKRDIEGMLSGYPPWYREPLPLASGFSMPHPIRDISDVSRGGWIVAVGIGTVQPLRIDLLTPPDSARERLEKQTVIRALGRVSHCLENLEKVFGGQTINLAQELISTTIQFVASPYGPSEFISSFARSLLTEKFGNLWFRERKRQFAKDLTLEQGILVTQIFNQYEKPSDKQIKDLDGILVIAVRAALVGAYFVAWEMHKRNQRCLNPSFGGHRHHHDMPTELETFRTVYLFESTED